MLPEHFPDATVYSPNGEPALRWGIYGAGMIAGKWVDAVSRHTAQRVHAVASRNREHAEVFARDYGIDVVHDGYDALVNDPAIDAIYIATPHVAHVQAGLEAIAGGKHVLIEKPIAVSADEARILVDAARAAGVLLMEGLWSRYLPQVSVIQQLIADGVIGEVRGVIANVGQGLPASYAHRLWEPEFAGGALLDVGVYPFQLDSLVLGAPTSITAVGTLAATGVDDSTTTVLGHGPELQSSIFTSISTRTPSSAVICGSGGRIELSDSLTGPSRLILSDSGYFTPKRVWEDTTGLWDMDALAWQATALARFVGEGRVESPVHTHEETLSIIATIDEARRQVGSRGPGLPAVSASVR